MPASCAITGTLLYTATLPFIGPGSTGIIMTTVDTGNYTFFVKADPSNAIAELDESNNLAVRQVTISNKIYLPVTLMNFVP